MRTFSTLLVMAAVLILQRPPQPTPAPSIGWVTRATVAQKDVYDGDTFTATVQMQVRVRLIDCWAPEVRGEDKATGLRSRDALRKMIQDGDGKITLLIPGSPSGELKDSFSFGRVLGHAWTSDHPEANVSDRMVTGGHATKTK